MKHTHTITFDDDNMDDKEEFMHMINGLCAHNALWNVREILHKEYENSQINDCGEVTEAVLNLQELILNEIRNQGIDLDR